MKKIRDIIFERQNKLNKAHTPNSYDANNISLQKETVPTISRTYSKKCQKALSNCCGKPPLCSLDGQDCHDIFKTDCYKLQKGNI